MDAVLFSKFIPYDILMLGFCLFVSSFITAILLMSPTWSPYQKTALAG